MQDPGYMKTIYFCKCLQMLSNMRGNFCVFALLALYLR